jgi:hypothetical protein
MRICVGVLSVFCLALLTAGAPGGPQEIVAKILDSDPFGMAGATVSARLVLKDKSGSSRQLAFSGRSFRYDPPFSKSIVRFSAPVEMAGAGFLQVQNRTGDDDRFLFLPELKRSRRISGSLRGSSFMGTDFTFADLDRRDLREAEAQQKPEENFGKFPCFRVDLAPKRSDSPYSKVEGWFRKDNYLPLQLKMYNRAGTLVKTFQAQEVKRVDGTWYVTNSRMRDLATGHTTDLLIDSVAPLKAASEDEFTVRVLERP